MTINEEGVTMDRGQMEKREALYDDIKYQINWSGYNGKDGDSCMLGQLAYMNNAHSDPVGGLSYLYDIDRDVLQTIWDRACEDSLAYSEEAALDMAWQTLELRPQ